MRTSKKRKVISNQQNNLLIREAIVNGRKYTPSQYDELTGKGKAHKDENYIPLCAEGHELNHVTSHKRNAFGKVIHVVSHFKHKHVNDNNCGYLKKYGSEPESEEHFQTKLFIANKKPSFLEKCVGPTCKQNKITHIPEDWIAKTEVKIENWFMDVVFYKDGIIQMVVEIYHTHSTKGKKRDYLMSQDYLYFEVKTQYSVDILHNSEELAFEAWDCKSDFLCGVTCCLTHQMLLEQQEKARKERLKREEERRIREEETKRLIEQKKRLLAEERKLNFDKKWKYFYKKYIVTNIINYATMAYKERRKKEDRYLKTQKEGRHPKYHISNEKKEAENQRYIKRWKNAPLNKKLSKECNLVFKHGRFKGCHYLLVCYICPSEINNLIKSNSCCPIYFQCKKLLQGRKLKEYCKTIMEPNIKSFTLNRKVIDDFLNNDLNYI